MGETKEALPIFGQRSPAMLHGQENQGFLKSKWRVKAVKDHRKLPEKHQKKVNPFHPPMPVRACLEVVLWKRKCQILGSHKAHFFAHSSATSEKIAAVRFQRLAFAPKAPFGQPK